MRCSEIRTQLPNSLSPAVEAHLSNCPNCFAWLESHDGLLQRLRQAKPELSAVPTALAGRIMQAWRPSQRSLVPGLIAFMLLALVGTALVIGALVAGSTPLTGWLSFGVTLVSSLFTMALAIATVLFQILTQYPLLLGISVLFSVAVLAIWVRAYQQSGTGPRGLVP